MELNNDTKMLLDMLTYRRRARTKGEIAFIEKYIKPVDNMEVDSYGNYYLYVGHDPVTLFSCHTDSVHIGNDVVKQEIEYDPYTQIASTPTGDVLGADDATGCFIMLKMIEAGVQGLYIFHRDEEVGGRGSGYISENLEWRPALERIKHAVAFDRCGYDDVIYSQMGRCCSDVFAQKLADELNVHMEAWGVEYKLAEGVFTDTAEYVDIIGECTNISVGYAHEHSSREAQDVGYAIALVNALININWEDMPSIREAGAEDDTGYYGYKGFNHSFYNQSFGNLEDEFTREDSYAEPKDALFDIDEQCVTDVARLICMMSVEDVRELVILKDITHEDIL